MIKVIKLEDKVNKLVKKYVVTTVQYNAPLNNEFYKSMKNYCAVNEAQMIVIPTTGKNITEEQILHPTLQSDTDILITNSYKFNNNLKLTDFGVRSQQINPLTGLERFAQGDTSYIMPGTKQVMKRVANSHNSAPKALMTTGALTHPYYNEKHRVGRIAKHDHRYGMIVVEVEDNNLFHFRNVKSLKNGKFIDLGKLYDGKWKPKKVRALAEVFGDIHPYQLNKVHQQASYEQSKQLNTENLFLHDTFNGYSISHHYKGANSVAYKVAKTQGLNLEEELKETLSVLKDYSANTKGNIYIVPSNHDEHLNRYLDEARFINDKGNDLIGAQIYVGYLQGQNPLQYGLSLVGEIPKNITFLNRNDDFKLKGYQLNRHGDRGSSGARGSQRTHEIANGKSITAHRHAPEIIRDSYVVGTSTDLVLDYTEGYYNSWDNTNAILYEDGSVQLLNTLSNGKWKSD